jgi:GTP-binding protein HflX
MAKPYITAPKQETAILVGVILPRQDEAEVNDYLDELEFLAETAGLKPFAGSFRKLTTRTPGRSWAAVRSSK